MSMITRPAKATDDEYLELCRKAHAEAFQRNGTAILAAFNWRHLHVYGGTVDDDTVIARRRRNRAARKSRRINRGRK